MVTNIGEYAMFEMLTERSPSITLHKKFTNTNSDKQSDDDRYKSSKPGKFTETSKVESITKIYEYEIKNKKALTTLNTKIEDMDD